MHLFLDGRDVHPQSFEKYYEIVDLISENKVSFYWVHYLGDSPIIPQYMNQTTPSRTDLLCKQLLHCISTDAYPPECADYYVRILLMELLAQHKQIAAVNA